MLAMALPAQGVETSVLCTHAGGQIADRLLAAGVAVTVAGGSSRQWRTWVEQSRPDVLSTHFVSVQGMATLSEWAPVVDTVHNTYVWLSPEEWDAERAKCELATSLVAVSETVATFHRRVAGSKPFSVIPNGVQGSRLSGLARSDARARLGIRADDVVLVHLGRFCVQKNQLGLVAALAHILGDDSRVRLFLVGGQEDAEYVDQVASRAGALLTRGAIRLLPATGEPGLVLSAADAFVSNAFFEGWSLAATEALWMGRPVILSDCGGSRELIGDDERRGILVSNPGGDPSTLGMQQINAPAEGVAAANREGMQRAVRSFIADRARWASRSDEIMGDARACWSADRMAASYASIFRAAANA